MKFDPNQLRPEFPILSQKVRGKPLVYLDNAATSQKPNSVLDAMTRYYEESNANVHRGVHALSERATELYEGARAHTARFLHAKSPAEIIFVRGATEAINLVARTYGMEKVQAGDEVLISALEHHSNIVPWQMLCESKGAKLRVIPMTDEGELRIDEYETLLSERTKIVSIVHVSNALGTINPVKQMIATAHARGIPVLLDGAQAVPHMQVDVQDLGCDFYVFSSHKAYGPTGIGALYGRAELLGAMPPYQGGGDMIRDVTFEKTLYREPPHRFEAGTPNIAGAVGLQAAIEFMERVGLENIARHEHELLHYATEKLRSIPGVHIVGTAKEKAAVLSFVIDGVHPHDIGTLLDQEGVAVRAGHHCTQPIMDRLGIPATARASFALYNTTDEIDALKRSIEKVLEIFRP